MNVHEWLRIVTQKFKNRLSFVLEAIFKYFEHSQDLLSTKYSFICYTGISRIAYENLGTTERKCSKGYHSCWHYFPPSNILFKSYLPSRTFRKGDADQTRGLRMTHCLSTTTPKGWRTCSDKYYPSSWRSTTFPQLRCTRVHLELSKFCLRLKSFQRMLENQTILLIFNRFIHVEKSK